MKLYAASVAFRNTAPEFKDRGLPGQRGDGIPQSQTSVEREMAQVARFYRKINVQLGTHPSAAA